jgi:hypothetical protein
VKPQYDSCSGLRGLGSRVLGNLLFAVEALGFRFLGLRLPLSIV